MNPQQLHDRISALEEKVFGKASAQAVQVTARGDQLASVTAAIAAAKAKAGK
jgi:hypothetical protein